MNIEQAINKAIIHESSFTDLSFADNCRRLVDNGVSENEGIGFHGTTVSAVVKMAQSGIFPTGLQDGGIYIFPRPSKIQIENPKCVLPESDLEAFDGCISYAQTIASEALLLRALGIVFESREVWSEFLFHVLSDEGLYDIKGNLEDKHYPDEIQFLAEDIGIKKLFELRKRIISITGGIVLALSENVLQDFIVEEAPPEDDGLRIICPNGIPIDYFDGLLALGDFEEDVLERCGLTIEK